GPRGGRLPVRAPPEAPQDPPPPGGPDRAGPRPAAVRRRGRLTPCGGPVSSPASSTRAPRAGRGAVAHRPNAYPRRAQAVSDPNPGGAPPAAAADHSVPPLYPPAPVPLAQTLAEHVNH